MKILHISTFDSGGAGLCCVRIHKGLLENGYDSKVLVLNKSFNESEVYKFEKKRVRLPKFIRWPVKLVKLIFQKLRIPLSCFQYFQYRLDALRAICSPFYTLPLSENDLSNHPLVVEADLIHLHWIAGFLDYPSFFNSVFKPIIWTLHDENLFFGGFHFKDEHTAHISIYNGLEKKLKEIKQKSVGCAKNLSIVYLSEMMQESFLSDIIVKNLKQYVIHNAVDPTIFKPYEKELCRAVFNLPRDKKILLFISYYLSDRRKGFSELVMAVSELNSSDIAICAIGIKNGNIDTRLEIYYPGAINDQRLMALAYSACDVYVLPSFQEAFAQTPLEAMACGLPVVAYPCSGTSELINEKNGVRTNYFTVDSLKEGIIRAIYTEFDPLWIRQDVTKRFDVKCIVDRYAEVYKEAIKDKQKIL